jgi:hypothetical protein
LESKGNDVILGMD